MKSVGLRWDYSDSFPITGISNLNAVYHQRANPSERRNQEVKKALRVHILDLPPAHSDERIDEIMFAMNNRRNAATGQPPSQLLLGAPLTTPGNQQHPYVLQHFRNDPQARAERVRRAQIHQQAYQEEVFPAPREAPVHFRVGQQVLTRSFGVPAYNLRPPWEGPYTVTAELGDGVYEVRRGENQDRIPVDDMRPAHGPVPDPRQDVDVLARSPPPDNEEDDLERAPLAPAPEKLPSTSRTAGTLSVCCAASEADPPSASTLTVHEVLVEDCPDEEEGPRNFPHQGVPVVGL
ncbi:hypothetical protein NQ318_020386 [Aromia moschata]|uniref:Integrase catalytic domain-containing protein n=1 Tax=Aromia moschata TaxID=1265417 RepID=A0AAV8Y253_9CUCU|nr:hypothetical protein NQ318_020386 [Aromia moschata]